jgi:uncharacterized protein
MADKNGSLFRKVITLPLLFYKRFISPLLPKACLYTPTCSEYAIGAIRKHGFFKGFFLGTARVFRCNGWFFSGGDDPVPDRFSWKDVREGFKKFRNK